MSCLCIYFAVFFAILLKARCDTCVDTCDGREVKEYTLMSREVRPGSVRCYCDTLCSTYNDCCVDFNPPRVKDIQRKAFTCARDSRLIYAADTPRDNKTYSMCSEMTGLYIVNSCPSGNKMLQSQCLAQDNLILHSQPVVGALSRVVYRNIFCALTCGEEIPIFWRVAIRCESGRTMPRKSITNLHDVPTGCGIYFEVPSLGSTILWPRLCRNITEKCSESFLKIQTSVPVFLRRSQAHNDRINFNCTDGPMAQVFDNTGHAVYKNLFCAQCNDVSSTSCVNTVFFTSVSVYPYSMLFDYQALLDLQNQYMNENLCPSGHKYHTITQKCLLVADVDCIVYLKTNFSLTEISVSRTSGVLNILATNITLPANRFVINTSGIFVCDDAVAAKYAEPYSDNIALRVWTMICLIASILGCVIVLIIYFGFSNLRNLPGKLIMNMAFALMLAQCLFLGAARSSASKTVCEIIGVLTHLLYMSFFIWTFVVSLDIWLTFRGMRLSLGGSTSRLIKYTAGAWLSAAAWVSMCVTINYSGVDDKYRPLYGQPLCWISSPVGLLIYFISPIMLLLLVNVLFFILAIRSIAEASRICAMSDVKRERSRFLICVKLVAISGITWLVGISAVFSRVLVLQFVFVFLNGCQGVFICISFVWTGNVRAMVSERFSSMKTTRSSELGTNRESAAPTSTTGIIKNGKY